MPYQRKQERRKPEELSVSISLTPGLMELAKELAAEAGMPLRPFLSQALKHILVVYSGKLGRKDKYVPEMTSSNTRRVRVWKQRPAVSEQAEAGQAGQAGERAGGTFERRQGGEGRKQKPSGSGKSRQRSQGQRRGTGGRWQGEQGAKKGKKASSSAGTRSKFGRGGHKSKSRSGGRQAGARARTGRRQGQRSEGSSAG